MNIGNIVTVKRVRIKNFLSIRSAEIDFSKFVGLNFVSGNNRDIIAVDDNDIRSNGAGKSSLFSAILFGLYGETIHDVKISSICHKSYLNEDVEVEIEILGLDKKTYRIFTIIEKCSTCRVYIYLEDNKEPINSISIKETRKFIEEKIIGIPIEIFRRRIILIDDGDQDYFGLRSDKKRQFIENSFGLNIFGVIYRLVHQDFLKLQRELVSIEQKIKHIETTISDLTKSQNEFKLTQDKKIEKTRMLINDEVKKIGNVFSKNTADMSQLTKLSVGLNNQIDVSREKITVIRDKLSKAEKVKFEAEHKINSYNVTKNKYSELVTQLCDECKNVVDVKFFEQFDIKKNLTTVEKVKSLISTIKTNLITIENDLNQCILSKNTISSSVRTLSMLKQTIATLITQESPIENLLKNNTINLNESKSLRDTKQNKYKFLNFADHVTSENGVKQFIIKNILDELNIRLQHYIIKLGGSFSCKFDEKFDTIFTHNNTEMEYNNFSNGEKVKLKLAILFVFRDMLFAQASVNFNIFIIDEFFDSSLDNFTLEKLLEILLDISKQQGCAIFIISHRDIIKDKSALFSGRILIEKHNGESSIKVQNE